MHAPSFFSPLHTGTEELRCDELHASCTEAVQRHTDNRIACSLRFSRTQHGCRTGHINHGFRVAFLHSLIRNGINFHLHRSSRQTCQCHDVDVGRVHPTFFSSLSWMLNMSSHASLTLTGRTIREYTGSTTVLLCMKKQIPSLTYSLMCFLYKKIRCWSSPFCLSTYFV